MTLNSRDSCYHHDVDMQMRSSWWCCMLNILHREDPHLPFFPVECRIWECSAFPVRYLGSFIHLFVGRIEIPNLVRVAPLIIDCFHVSGRQSNWQRRQWAENLPMPRSNCNRWPVNRLTVISSYGRIIVIKKKEKKRKEKKGEIELKWRGTKNGKSISNGANEFKRYSSRYFNWRWSIPTQRAKKWKEQGKLNRNSGIIWQQCEEFDWNLSYTS